MTNLDQAMYEFYQEMSEDWFSVAETLPPAGKTVLTIGYTSTGWAVPIPAYYKDGQFLMALNFNSDSFVGVIIETKPTFWMNLPKPPNISDSHKNRLVELSKP